MVYSDVKKFGLCGIIPHKKRYGTHKDITIVTNAIKQNNDFCQFALSEDNNATCINDIIGKLTRFVLLCNEIYNDDNIIVANEKRRKIQ